MARLLRPVMKIMSVMPAAAASSTAYWISGLSTIGIISFGLALVAGKNRVPKPATGKTALVIFCIVCTPSRTRFVSAPRKTTAHNGRDEAGHGQGNKRRVHVL